MNIQIYDSYQTADSLEKQNLVNFLFRHLDEFGDTKEAITKAINYAIGETSMVGGFVLEGKVEDRTVGVVVVNRTGMESYIPQNILVYIAVDASQRGKGIGRTLMNKAIELAKGDVALHVEPNNPARFLYENIGFKNKYLEYRLIRS